jgi:hypothetical protein
MMRIKVIAQILVFVAGLCIASSSHAVTVLDGTTGGGAFFRIMIPDGVGDPGWNGKLVIWNHGFSLAPPGPVTDLGPLRDFQVFVEGYAVAASSYQQFGWALFKTVTDNKQLYQVFVDNFGVPSEVILTGASLGAIVTAQMVEKGGVGNVVGALPVCGALAGGRNWDAGIDLRLVYDAVCAGVPGAFLPGGATGLPEPGFPTYALNPPDPINNGLFMALALDVCFGILNPPQVPPTPAQQARAGAFFVEAGIEPTFIVTDMGFALFGMSDLIWNFSKLKGKRGFGNIGVTYDIPSINFGIQRVAPIPGGEARMRQNFTPKGTVGDVKIITLHEKRDGLVIAENETEYHDVVPASQLTQGIVDNAVANHCGFTPAEGLGAWLSLEGWLAGAPQPTAADLQGACMAATGAPFFQAGPCRVEPACSPGSGQNCDYLITPAYGVPNILPGFIPTSFPDGMPNMDIRVPPR